MQIKELRHRFPVFLVVVVVVVVVAAEPMRNNARRNCRREAGTAEKSLYGISVFLEKRRPCVRDDRR